jgi:hypothetical protein
MSVRVLLCAAGLTVAAGGASALPPVHGRADDAKVEQARAGVEAHRERVAWAERMAKRGYLSQAQAQAERARLAEAEAALLKAEAATVDHSGGGFFTGLARRYAAQIFAAQKKVEIAQAHADQARERSAWAERMVKMKYMSPAQAQAQRARMTEAADTLRKATEELDALRPKPEKP